MVVEAMPTILNMLSRNDAAKAERYLERKCSIIIELTNR